MRTAEEKLRALIAEAQDMQNRDPQRALERADLALALIGEREDLLKEKADALNAKGNALWTLSDYPRALDCCEQSLATFERLGDKRGVARALNGIGNVYERLSDCAKALECHQQSLAMCWELGDK
ncbi:MAG: tetratricopeptide repeat protein, partial [Chloroherpetonaceae bacterium]|nr:tetratricopeptide repeat protein [Chloroherpetonaceae bacterium]